LGEGEGFSKNMERGRSRGTVDLERRGKFLSGTISKQNSTNEQTLEAGGGDQGGRGEME